MKTKIQIFEDKFETVTLQQQTFLKTSQGKCDILNCDTPVIKKSRRKYKLHSYSTAFDYKEKRCACGCKRVVTGRKIYYDASCRKRAERKRNYD